MCFPDAARSRINEAIYRSTNAAEMGRAEGERGGGKPILAVRKAGICRQIRLGSRGCEWPLAMHPPSPVRKAKEGDRAVQGTGSIPPLLALTPEWRETITANLSS
jgi:hypothetical protein